MTRGDVFILGIILGGASLYLICTLWQRWLRKRRFVGAKRSEEKAANLLEQQGFHIVCRQPKASSLAYVNGMARTTTIRADFIARKGWRRYVVEVKSGRTASRLNARTRRQLLEYQLAFQPDSILLVDMSKNNYREISFRRPIHWRSLLPTVTACAIAFVLGGTTVYILGKGMW